MNATVETLPARPNPVHFKPLKECKNIGEALQTKEFMDRLRQSVPKHLSPERMLRTCVLAINKTPKLAQAPMMELLGAMLTLASLGMEPNTPLGHAYLIPFDKNTKVGNKWEKVTTIQVVIGYKGFLSLARNSGNLVSIHADVVYEGDEFSFEYGSKMHLRHVPQGEGDSRKPLWAYAHAKLTDGEAFEVLPYNRVLKIRDGSQGYQAAKGSSNAKSLEKNPWVAHEHEMAAKTMIRRISKMLPMSIEFMNAAALDSMSEGGNANFRAVAESTTIYNDDMVALAASDEEPIDTSVNVSETVGEPVKAAAEPANHAAQQADHSAPPVTTKDKAPPDQQQPAKGEADLADIPDFLKRNKAEEQKTDAPVAQLDEQPSSSRSDAGSSPAGGAKDKAQPEPWSFQPVRGKAIECSMEGFIGNIENGIDTAAPGQMLDNLMAFNGEGLKRLENVNPDAYASILDRAGAKGWAG